MSKYVYIYRGGAMPETPEEQEAEMAKWGAWFEAMGDAVVDGGNPFGEVRTVSAGGSISSGGGATGYSTIEAADIDAALAHAKGCPILDAGGSVEVAAAIDM